MKQSLIDKLKLAINAAFANGEFCTLGDIRYCDSALYVGFDILKEGEGNSDALSISTICVSTSRMEDGGSESHSDSKHSPVFTQSANPTWWMTGGSHVNSFYLGFIPVTKEEAELLKTQFEPTSEISEYVRNLIMVNKL